MKGPHPLFLFGCIAVCVQVEGGLEDDFGLNTADVSRFYELIVMSVRCDRTMNIEPQK